MSKYLISRIVMLPNGTAHIALFSGETINCSRNNLLQLLSDPQSFRNGSNGTIKRTTAKVNPRHRSLETIPGLTLMKVYSDSTTVCRFPKLFQALLNNLDNDSDKPFNLKEFVLGLDFSDEKHFLMKFFYDFTNEPRSEIVIHNSLGIEPDEQNEIMSETFNTVFNSVAPDTEQEAPKQSSTEPTLFKPKLATDMITVKEFASEHGVKDNVVLSWIENKKMPNAVKIKGRWYLPRNKVRKNGYMVIIFKETISHI